MDEDVTTITCTLTSEKKFAHDECVGYDKCNWFYSNMSPGKIGYSRLIAIVTWRPEVKILTSHFAFSKGQSSSL